MDSVTTTASIIPTAPPFDVEELHENRHATRHRIVVLVRLAAAVASAAFAIFFGAAAFVTGNPLLLLPGAACVIMTIVAWPFKSRGIAGYAPQFQDPASQPYVHVGPRFLPPPPIGTPPWASFLRSQSHSGNSPQTRLSPVPFNIESHSTEMTNSDRVPVASTPATPMSAPVTPLKSQRQTRAVVDKTPATPMSAPVQDENQARVTVAQK